MDNSTNAVVTQEASSSKRPETCGAKDFFQSLIFVAAVLSVTRYKYAAPNI